MPEKKKHTLDQAAPDRWPPGQPWFHLSRADLGAEFRFEPWVPAGAAIGEDRKTKRIPVAADFEDCVLAITWTKAVQRTFQVYRLAESVDVDRPPMWAVPDDGDTREHWILEPALFRRIGTIAVPCQDPWQWPDDNPTFTWMPDRTRKA